MRTSTDGVDRIKRREGFEGTAYQDAAAHWTIGYGFTDDILPGLKEGDTITVREADIVLVSLALPIYEGAVNRNVKVPITQSMFDALVSFTYNLGETNLKESTLLWKLNDRKYQEAADEFRKWIMAGGKPVKGLMNRRAEEREQFMEDGLPGEKEKIIVPRREDPMPIPVPQYPQPKSAWKTSELWFRIGFVVIVILNAQFDLGLDLAELATLLGVTELHGLSRAWIKKPRGDK